MNLLGSHNHGYSKISIPKDCSGKPRQVTRDYLESQRPRFVIEAEMFSLRPFLERETSRNYWRFLPHSPAVHWSSKPPALWDWVAGGLGVRCEGSNKHKMEG